VSTGSSIKYSQIKSLVDRLSTALHHKGFRRGSSVILMASNFVELPLFTLAVWSLGGCLAALTLNLPPGD
jgi:acyl-coenzyme A synthetase/AMP-(fatty) acid ligase